jgi:SAM-dependent methyltransferase
MQVVSKRYEDFVARDFERYVGWHRRALESPPEQYRVLREWLRATLPGTKRRALLNLCAANGNLLAYLQAAQPAWRYVGLDTVPELLTDESATAIRARDITLEACPIEAVESRWAGQFDVVVHWMRLLHFDDWRAHLRGAVRAARPGGHVFVSSLFNDHDVDLMTTLCDYSISACRDGYCLAYNTLSAAEVERYCRSLGAQEVEFRPFELPFDIPRTATGVGTYTVRTADGRRLSISAGLLMSWQMLHAVV